MRGMMLFVGLAIVACGPTGETDGDDSPVVGLELSPDDATLIVIDGVAAQQGYTLMARFEDGSIADVTADASFGIDDTRLGGFSGAEFTTSNVAGGRGLVQAGYDGSISQATLTILVENTRVEPPAPDNAPDLFSAATEDAGLAPAIVYPSDQTIVPPNLGDFETHWSDTAGNDLFEVTLSGQFSTTRVYGTGNFAELLPGEWAIAGESHRGDHLTVTVRGLSTASPATAGTSAPIDIELTDENVLGGIYYWASTGGSPAGIYRHDMDRPGQPAEAFYTTDESPSGRCVACHVLSRDGTKMALTFDGGNGASSVLDVASKSLLMADDGTFKWNFATFEPDGSRVLTVHQGVMSLRDPQTGTVVNTVPTAGWATHPDFSPMGDAIVYTTVAGPGQDWNFTGGSIVVQDFDPTTGAWGAATPLITPPPGTNVYYPSWSPDGEWIIYNQSTEDAYDDASAELYVVPANGSFAPIKLDSPNFSAGLTNSWARWAPFAQTYHPGGEDTEPFFWLTFSSKRVFGVRLGAGTPQVWMAPFFPARAVAGTDPSGPAFRLPFQELGTNNHIAQWTEAIIQ